MTTIDKHGVARQVDDLNTHKIMFKVSLAV